VLTRVQTRERPVGVVLLENLLAAGDQAARPVYPEDGAVLVPGPIALTADCRNPTAARAIYDLVLSPEGQRLIVAGNMYAALPSIPPPEGAAALDTIPVRAWTPGWVEQVTAEQASIKERWTR
jgi:iron(III) transport system substrate-binding protein